MESLLEVIRQNIAGWCQQTYCFQKFVDNPQQCFAFTPHANFPAPNLNFHWGWRWSRLPFKIFSTLVKGTEESMGIRGLVPTIFWRSFIVSLLSYRQNPNQNCVAKKKSSKEMFFSCPKGDFENLVRFNLPKKNTLHGLILKKECSNFIKFKFYFDKKNLRQRLWFT